MSKKNLKNYWIKPFIIILSLFFFNSAKADVKINASKQISDFLQTIKVFASEKNEAKKKKISNLLLDMIDLEFMSKATVGKYWKTAQNKDKIIFKTNLFNKFINFIDLHLEDFKEMKFERKSVKLRGTKLVYVIGTIDTKKIKNLDITWKLSSKKNKILDIEIQKISLIKTQKLEMKELLRKNKDNFSNFVHLYFKKNN